MDLSLVPLLRCPSCLAAALDQYPLVHSAEGRCRDGVLVCRCCRAWFPISEFVLALLPEGREQPGIRDEFWSRHRIRLANLGLQPPAPPHREPDPGFAAQAHQREHFDDLARREDKYSLRAFSRLPFQRAFRDLTFEQWRRRIEPGSVVLDIGCGDGISTFDLAGSGARVLGFDISRESVVRAAAGARERGMPGVSFFVGDADAIPVANAAVDCVLCFGALHHVPDPARTLGEAGRVLRTGGLYFGVENNRTPLRPAFDLLARLWSLWREEAGAEAQISSSQLEQWTRAS